MTKITVVPQREVCQTWPHVEAFFAEVIPHAHGDFTLEQLRTDLFTGRLELLVAREEGRYVGAFALVYQNRRNARVAHVTAMGGRMVSTPEVWSQLQFLFIANGATEVECATYAAAQRLCAKFGFKEKYRVLGVSL